MKGRDGPQDAQRRLDGIETADALSGQPRDHGTAGDHEDGHGTPSLFDLNVTVTTHPDHGRRTVCTWSSPVTGRPLEVGPGPVSAGPGPTGAELRDAVLERVDRAATDAQRAEVDRALDGLILAGVPFSANELRPLVAQVRPALIGARVRAAATAGRIVRTGYVPSTSPRTHAHPVAVWSPVAAGGTS